MGKATQEQLTASEVAAEETVSAFIRQHGSFARIAFSERDADGGLMEGSRMRRLAPARALEGLAAKHPKTEKPFLSEHHIMAANRYHDMLEAAHGRMNHELGETVDSSPNPGGRTLAHLAANDAIARLHGRMGNDHRSVLDVIFEKRNESTMAEIWPIRSIRNGKREVIRDALAWLSVEFGYRSR